MKSVIIISFSNELDKVLNILRRENVKIKYIISCPTQDLSQILDRNNINSKLAMYDELPEILQSVYFDYVIISDVKISIGEKRRIVEDCKKLGCLDEQIIDVTDFYSADTLSLYNLVRHYLDNDDFCAEFFLTGVSHAYAGTDMRCYSKTGLNLAYTSQDLFLDFELAKIVMSKKRTLKHAIIGVAPFSLHYDLSRSINAYRTLLYYPIIKKVHNMTIKDSVLREIFNDVYFNSFEMFDSAMVFDQRLSCASCNKNITVDDYLTFRNNLKFWDNKYYSDTVIENKKILRDYVEYCMDKNIKPTLVIFPLSRWYNMYFSKKKFDEVREYCQNLANERGIKFYDLSNDNRFNDSDFFDVEHLNINGAQKVSKIISQIIFG